MGQLSIDQLEYAVARLERLVSYRELTQTQLEHMSGVKQPTISKILSHSEGEDDYLPTEENLAKLFQSLGLNLFDILNEPDCLPEKIFGYLATPLTALTEPAHKGLRGVVSAIRAIAADKTFDPPPFEIYWPGDYTHPLDHAALSARQVYLTDRSRASTHDFIILFCGDPSYGVGQENEIATQAGIPAIRLVPKKGISRMMAGSFVRAIDVKYDGTLESSVTIPRNEMLKALQDTRRLCFRHRAFYHGESNEVFGTRLKRLVIDRYGGDYPQCADDLGISREYLQALMEEPLSVSNPGTLLLDRISRRLCTRVGYLLGESEVTDPIYVASNASWRKWVDSSDVDGSTALRLRDTWRDEFHRNFRARAEVSVASYRSAPKLMEVKDWDELYRAATKARGGRPIQTKML